MAEVEKIPEGWNWMVNATKFHYFRGNESLCKRWMLFAVPKDMEPDNGPSKDDCKACRRALDKEKVTV